MTSPILPSSVPNLPSVVAGQSGDAAAIRMGTVAEVYPTGLMVRVGSATVPTQAAWLSSYEPILGDVVAVARQGGMWVTLGSLGATISEDNNDLANPGFEDGAVGATPPRWSLVTTAGTPSVSTVAWDWETRSDGIDGSQAAAIVASAGVVTCELVSDPVPVLPGVPWAAAGYYRTLSDFATTSVCTTSLTLSWYSGSSLGSLLSSKTSGTHVVTRGMRWRLMRAQGTRGVTVPAGANFLRVRLALSWTAATAGDAVYFDRIVARSVG